METRIEPRSNRIVVHCAGRLDAAGGPLLEGVVAPLLQNAAEEIRLPVMLDLSAVDYLSSAGIRSLMVLVKTARQCGAGQGLALLRVLNLSPQVRQVLEMTGLLDTLAGNAPLSAATAKPAEKSGKDFRALLEDLRKGFPSPVSDPMKDAYFVHTISRGLDRLDGLKTERPYLGERRPLDYAQARQAAMPAHMSTLEATVDELARCMEGLVIFGHPRTQQNVGPPPSIPSIVGQLFCSIYNPNIIWDIASHRLAQIEVEVASMCAALVGYDPAQANGVFTFGGTGTVFYAVRLGIEKASPGAFHDGVRQDLKVVSSSAGHYAKLNALGWLGVGMKNLVTVPTDEDNAMGLAELEAALRGILDKGERIACIIATMGTTDAFGIDNLDYVVRLRDRLVDEYALDYRPHVHADAVIGWAWSVFNDYDFTANPLGFPPRTLRSLWDAQTGIRALGMADSVGFDFHKTGYTPYISSLFLCKNQDDLHLVSRDKALMPYLFQFGNYHPGVFTMETSRFGGSVLSAWANLRFLGKDGYRALLGHIVTMAETLRQRLEAVSFACPVNDYNYGPVTLFRVYPEGVDAATAFRREAADPGARDQLLAHNEYNEKISEALRAQMDAGEGLDLSLTSQYRVAACGEPIVALKSFVMSPFVDEAAMDRLMACLEAARKSVG